jgi:PAS domain S-box-containing protein
MKDSLTHGTDLFEDAPCGFMSLLSDGKISAINGTLLQWLEYTKEEVIMQKSLQDFLGIGGKIYLETHMIPLLLMQGEFSEIKVELKGKYGKIIPVLINGKKIKTSDALQTQYRLSILNISQRDQYEKELLKAKKTSEDMVHKLQKANTLLEQFAFTASHDLKAPLNTSIGLIDMLLEDDIFKEESKQKSSLTIVRENANRMKSIISDLLQYAQIDNQSPSFKEFSLQDACEEALEMIEDSINSSNALVTVQELPKIKGSKIQFIRLFQNLFDNAIKYRSTERPEINVSFIDHGESLTVYIKDNGIGFEQTKASQVFDFMKRLKTSEPIQGTGIGLFSCKRIVENHGGSINVESAVGKGSSFFFQIPK